METMKFTSQPDFAEWIAITHGIVEAFAGRGYALYAVGAAQSMTFLGSMEALGELISFGPEEQVLEIGIRFIPLPLVAEGQRADVKVVFAAAAQLLENMRGPFFIDMETQADGSAMPKGAHLIDSIFVEPPNLCMVIDSRFGSGRKGQIELPLATAAHQISKQLMLGLRTNSIPVQTPIKNKMPLNVTIH